MFRLMVCVLALLATQIPPAKAQPLLPGREQPSPDVLTERQWRLVHEASDRGLAWLASQQRADGSFRCTSRGQPGVTSLGTLAFLAHGHVPGDGPYGEVLNRAIRYVLRCQKANGLISVPGPNQDISASRPKLSHEIGVAACYNHAISGLMLSEAYGMCNGGALEERLGTAIREAVQLTLQMQSWKKQRRLDYGGLRYLHEYSEVDADLSVVGWHLKLLRSAKNSGFEVPQQSIDDAVAYVLRCFNKEYQTFEYDIYDSDGRTRAMAGVGILALAHSSRHERPEAMAAAKFILQEDFTAYNHIRRFHNNSHQTDRYHYGVFMCTMAMYQIGGGFWQQHFPRTAKTLLDHQRTNGAWDIESNQDQAFGQSYTTSLALLALSAPNQLLPIYQR